MDITERSKYFSQVKCFPEQLGKSSVKQYVKLMMQKEVEKSIQCFITFSLPKVLIPLLALSFFHLKGHVHAFTFRFYWGFFSHLCLPTSFKIFAVMHSDTRCSYVKPGKRITENSCTSIWKRKYKNVLKIKIKKAKKN
jgi:hypothetical protein